MIIKEIKANNVRFTLINGVFNEYVENDKTEFNIKNDVYLKFNIDQFNSFTSNCSVNGGRIPEWENENINITTISNKIDVEVWEKD